jgi:hypothetical protein
VGSAQKKNFGEARPDPEDPAKFLAESPDGEYRQDRLAHRLRLPS